jgi:MscS family membrane protein
MKALFDFANEALDRLQLSPALQALVIILAFLFLAKIVDKVISLTIVQLTRKTLNSIDDQLIANLHRPIFASVAMTGLILASHRLELSDSQQLIVVGIVKSILTVLWLIFALRLSKIFISAMRKQEHRFEFVQHTTEPLLTNLLAVIAFITGAYAIMLVWKIDVTGLVASAGIVGLALSFAAQDTLANLFAGVAILTDQPYKIGDYIILDTGERGQVTQIGLRSTRLLTREDVEVSIPNGVMGAAKIVNEAGGPPHRFRINTPVGVAYGSDIDKVMEILTGVAHDHDKVLANPEPRARFRTFGDSSLDFDLLCWISNPADRGLVVHELNCEIYRQFAAGGVEIPFPQRDVHIKNVPGRDV